MAKIRYNKGGSGKLLGGGGPRDKQMRQRIRFEEVVSSRMRPSLNAEVADKPPVVNMPPQHTDMSQYLPLVDVRKKIEQAVESTRSFEHDRYDSGLKNLNMQLNNERKKALLAEEKLINANAEILRLRNQLTTASDMPKEASGQLLEKDNEIAALKKELSDLKNTTIYKLEQEVELRKNSDQLSDSLAKDLQNKLDRLYEKISDGSIQSLVGSKMDRPDLEDKIFIDPIEKGREDKLDSFINIEEEETKDAPGSRSIETDLTKLRNLLKL